jgi:hypothetical protein
MLIANKFVHLPTSDEADTGSGGDRPARNNLTKWNGTGSASSPNLFFYSNCLCLRKRFVLKKQESKGQLLTRKKVNTERDKTYLIVKLN